MSPLDSAGEMAGVLGKADFPRYCASVKDRQLLDDESIEADFIARETRREERREAKAIACKARDTALRHTLRIAGWQCPVVGPGIFRTGGNATQSVPGRQKPAWLHSACPTLAAGWISARKANRPTIRLKEQVHLAGARSKCGGRKQGSRAERHDQPYRESGKASKGKQGKGGRGQQAARPAAREARSLRREPQPQYRIVQASPVPGRWHAGPRTG